MFLPGDDLVVGHEVGHLLGQALQLTVGGPATHTGREVNTLPTTSETRFCSTKEEDKHNAVKEDCQLRQLLHYEVCQ